MKNSTVSSGKTRSKISSVGVGQPRNSRKSAIVRSIASPANTPAIKPQMSVLSQRICFMLKSLHELRFWKFPLAVQDFGAREKEPHHVIPTRHSRQTIRNLAVAAAELNRNRAVRIFLGRDVVHRIDIVLVWFQIALGVVNGN